MDAGVFFVVHVWRDVRGFHATARDVTCEEAAEFADAATLARFLCEHGTPAAGGSASPRVFSDDEAQP